MRKIYRLSSFQPNAHGFNEQPFKSMKSLNKAKEDNKSKGFTKFIVDVYEVKH